MKLIRLIYHSRSRLADWYDSRDCGMAEIMATSVANNLRDQITGALICDQQWFAQALEGAESEVSATFERILRDQRHRDVSLVTMQAVSERRFAGFAMVCVARAEDNADLFRHYGEDEHFDPRQMRADRLFDLIEAAVGRTSGGAQWTTKSVTTAA